MAQAGRGFIEDPDQVSAARPDDYFNPRDFGFFPHGGEGPIAAGLGTCYFVLMNPILLILLLILLFGGGGFYIGGPMIGGGGLGLILLIVLIIYLMGGLRGTKS